MFKILIIGLGSAGQRHLRILIKILGKKNTEFYCLRTTKRNLIIDDNLKTKKTLSLPKFYNLREITLDELKKFNFDLAIISNPINKHLTSAIRLAKKK